LKNFNFNVLDYFEETDGLIFVIDSSDSERIKDCKDELSKLLFEEKLAGCSLLIFANKQDLKNTLSIEEISKVNSNLFKFIFKL